jgi:hypothetical protein
MVGAGFPVLVVLSQELMLTILDLPLVFPWVLPGGSSFWGTLEWDGCRPFWLDLEFLDGNRDIALAAVIVAGAAVLTDNANIKRLEEDKHERI